MKFLKGVLIKRKPTTTHNSASPHYAPEFKHPRPSPLVRAPPPFKPMTGRIRFGSIPFVSASGSGRFQNKGVRFGRFDLVSYSVLQLKYRKVLIPSCNSLLLSLSSQSRRRTSGTPRTPRRTSPGAAACRHSSKRTTPSCLTL